MSGAYRAVLRDRSIAAGSGASVARMRITVTGANGLVGSRLCRLLVAQGTR